MVTARQLRYAPVAACVGYCVIGACVICRLSVTSVTAADQESLIWSVVHVVVVGWMIEGDGCHATSKVVESSCELYYAISFWTRILSWKYQHFVEISTSHGYYPYFVYISIFRRNIHVPWILSTFRGYYPHFVDIIRISWGLSAFRGNIHVQWIFSTFRLFYISHFTHLVKVAGDTRLLLPVCRFSTKIIN